MTPQPKQSNLTDKYVGARVRLRRIHLGMSQTDLGEGIGLTFQQVQKYEKGVNRIGASRLSQISTILQVPVEWFFEGLPKTKASGQPAALDYTRDFLATTDGVALVKAFLGIKSQLARKRLVALARAMPSNSPHVSDVSKGQHRHASQCGIHT
jgi:transcriptional regulator with XRE-family HTH domain